MPLYFAYDENEAEVDRCIRNKNGPVMCTNCGNHSAVLKL